MSADEDALREMARNRGCKLVKSRVRTPGRRDYGRFGLTDTRTGKQVLGFGKRGLTATAAEIEDFLRGGIESEWKRSLGGARPAKRGAPARKEKKAGPQPEVRICEATPRDSDQLAGLISALGYEVTEADVRRRLVRLRKVGRPVLVAARGREVIGCLTLSVMATLHRPKPVGRISMLVVREAERGGGIGTRLVAAAEAWLEEQGCGVVEVTSNTRRTRAHAFYERLGYDRTSYRFARDLALAPRRPK